tara:strand:+ start:63 stop:980 length:918 start_codon:yes stop_codon:yes gene_type:complete
MTQINQREIISKKLYGLNKHLIDLSKLFDFKKLPKVLMLTGKKGQGKFTLIQHLLSYVMDKDNYDLNLATVKDKNKVFYNFKENTNPNIIYIKCDDNKFKIDDIRSLRNNLQKSSINNFQRFIIFDDVECLNDNCINALLKTIEEPSKTNYFILINNQNSNVLDTLKSRCIELFIFLNQNERLEIIKRLTNDLKIEKKIDIKNTTLTPGSYLKYNQILEDEKMSLKDKLISNIEKLFKSYKQKKNIEYLNFAIYLVNQYYFEISKTQSNVTTINEKRVNIIKKIQETNKLNLNQANLITEIENYI